MQVSALERRLREKPTVKLDFVLDLNRSTRPGKRSTANLLLPLLRQFPTQVNVSMFRSPSLRGMLAKIVPPRFNEGWGTWHAKIYGVDDDVMISGYVHVAPVILNFKILTAYCFLSANLNESYFTNRQDRYIYFSDQPELARYCHEFMQLVTPFSYKLLPSGSQSPDTTSSVHSYTQDDYTLHWPEPDTHPHYFNSTAEAAFKSFQKRSRERQSPSPSPKGKAALLFPVIQAGQFNIQEEETIFSKLFRFLSRDSGRPLLDLTSGYFSLYTPYQEHIVSAKNVDCRIVAASPKVSNLDTYHIFFVCLTESPF